jgi:hypothetical protein
MILVKLIWNEGVKSIQFFVENSLLLAFSKLAHSLRVLAQKNRRSSNKENHWIMCIEAEFFVRKILDQCIFFSIYLCIIVSF